MLTAIENFSRVASSRVPLAIEGVTGFQSENQKFSFFIKIFSGGSIRATDVETISRFLPSGLAAASCYKAFQFRVIYFYFENKNRFFSKVWNLLFRSLIS